ncbi:RraA family protein [Niallia endozanthoxylica]|uniref:Putative 4-hydroxy-4-methyl-2-oxoglutarate aldolase n=1 Tax=Niallia endozanthoxylica TaxID=2036016 RepID=A0A5J5I1S4_9BACI|nr:RraA family protein [Niallia endozanthoxylica]KAA9028489.1 RraA family protein [Niallia endozanthoxylica]
MSSIEEKFLSLPTTGISDALKGHNHMNTAIKPIKDTYKIAGRAFTISIPAGDNTGILRGIRDAKKGDVLVVDGKGYTERAVAGDFVISLAQSMGLQGIIIDGAIRDIQGIKDLDFPVFCRASTIAASIKAAPGELQIPISCGGVSVSPGDIIVGDADGVIVVPSRIEEKILAAADEKIKKDQERQEKYSGSKEKALQYLISVLGD